MRISDCSDVCSSDLLAASRRYLPLNVPLVKRVAAYAGDEICALESQVFINGRWAAERREADATGRPMPSWTGCLVLRGRQLLLLMDNPSSFDGRYFGPRSEEHTSELQSLMRISYAVF